MKKISKTYVESHVQHMENRNRNINKDTKEKGGAGEREK